MSLKPQDSWLGPGLPGKRSPVLCPSGNPCERAGALEHVWGTVQGTLTPTWEACAGHQATVIVQHCRGFKACFALGPFKRQYFKLRSPSLICVVTLSFQLIYLKIAGMLFPTSDFWHPVVTPALVCLSQLLTKVCPCLHTCTVTPAPSEPASPGAVLSRPWRLAVGVRHKTGSSRRACEDDKPELRSEADPAPSQSPASATPDGLPQTGSGGESNLALGGNGVCPQKTTFQVSGEGMKSNVGPVPLST